MSAGGFATPPPPSPQLLAAMAGLRPVRTRRPLLALALATLVSAAYAALATAALLLTVGLLLTPHAEPATVIPVGAHATMRSIRHCVSVGLAFAVVPMVAGMVALRRLLLVGGARLMAAVGAAAGAFAGTVLHVICAFGGGMHTGFGHGGAMVAATLVGAAIGVVLGRMRA
jgi:hypothetical protein